MGLGAVLLGYDLEECDIDPLHGNTFTLPHHSGVYLAEKLVEILPCAEMVRFCKNGSDATEGAVRIARAVTGRKHIAYCGYHGSHDWSAVTGGLLRGLIDDGYVLSLSIITQIPFSASLLNILLRQSLWSNHLKSHVIAIEQKCITGGPGQFSPSCQGNCKLIGCPFYP